MRDLRGEVSGGPPPDRLMVEMVSQGRPLERVPVMPDGSFEFRSIGDGDYEFRVVNFYGDVVQREYASVQSQSGSLVIRLPERKQARPVNGTVSMRELLKPVPPKAYKEFLRADKLSAKGKLAESIQHLEKAIRIHPDYVEAYTNLGARLMRVNDIPRAADAFQKAVELDPSSPLAQTNLAVALISLGRSPEAEVAARQALARDANFIQAKYALGLAYATQGRCVPEAVDDLNEASERFPGARLAAARLLTCCGAKQRAAEQLRLYLDSPQAAHRGQIEAWLTALAPAR